MSSNSPSGGIKEMVRSFSKRDSRTHWLNFTSSSSTDLLLPPAQRDMKVPQGYRNEAFRCRKILSNLSVSCADMHFINTQWKFHYDSYFSVIIKVGFHRMNRCKSSCPTYTDSDQQGILFLSSNEFIQVNSSVNMCMHPNFSTCCSIFCPSTFICSSPMDSYASG